MLDDDELVQLSHSHLSPSTFLGVFSVNRLPEKLPHQTFHTPVCFIANTDTGNLAGKHWYAIAHYPNGYGEVFDSFGSRPSPTVERWMNRHCSDGWRFQTNFLQGPLSTLCGYYCIFFLKERLHTYPHLAPLQTFIVLLMIRRYFKLI